MPKNARLPNKHGVSYAQALKAEIDKVGPRPKIADIGVNFIKEAGGPRNFGALLWKEFNQAEEGSLARQRILALVIQTIKADEDPYSSEILEGLEDDDIEQMLQENIAVLVQNGVLNVGAERPSGKPGSVPHPADPVEVEGEGEQERDAAGLGTEASAEAEGEEQEADGSPPWSD